MVQEQLEALGYKFGDKTVNMLMDGYEVFESKPDELYFRVGIGVIKLNNLPEVLKKAHEKAKKKSSGWSFPWFKNTKEDKKEDYVIDGNDDKHKYVIASCCNPIPGDSVVGFKASDGTITVHRRTCARANSLAAKFGDKIVAVKWAEEENSSNNYLARIDLKGTDRIGMINDITILTSKVMGVNIRRFNIGTEDGIFEGFIDLYVHDIAVLEKLIQRLQQIPGITSVAKTEL